MLHKVRSLLPSQAKIRIRTEIPGKKSYAILRRMKELNGAHADLIPFVHSGRGSGCYCEDVDGNRFLDFASQIATNPFGYNHPRMLKVIKKYQRFPLKYAGQDFTVPEHRDLLEELLSLCPGFDAAFLINSGAEAVENAIKIATRYKPSARFGISFEQGFHGRMLGALSSTNSKSVHKAGYWRFPMFRLPYTENMKEAFTRILEQEAAPEDIGFVIIEPVQGEGGYHIPSAEMMKELSKMCHEHKIPLIADEVQAGMGRTGKWWAHQHFEFHPDIISSAKALQVGAVISNQKMFPKEVAAISSTWGGGHILDLALGVESIHIIKDEKLLEHNTKMGRYLVEKLCELPIESPRGLGLMCAFDLESVAFRNTFVLEAIKNGLIVLGCGERGVRLIPPYIVSETEIDEAIGVLDKALETCRKKGFKQKGKICDITGC